MALRAFSIAWAIAISGVAQAAPLYDNFGPGMTYDLQNGWIVGLADQGADYAPYGRFTPMASGFVTAGLAALTHDGGPREPLRFELRADDGGQPGDVLASGLAELTGGVMSATFESGTFLSAGRSYWFGMKTTDPATAATWRLNSTGDLGTQAFTGAAFQQPGEWFLQAPVNLGAFRIDGNVAVIPEPSAALLFVAGLGMVVLRKRRSGALTGAVAPTTTA